MQERTWLPVTSLAPNKRNPRIGRSIIFDAVAASMREIGFKQEKPLLVRPTESGKYEIIGGHTRWQAAQEAGLKEVLCIIEEMDDDTATLRLAEDNISEPFPWYSIALYIVQNSDKGSKKGLSRTALVKACMGKIGPAAKVEATRRGSVGEVLLYLGVGAELQSETLLEADTIDRLLNPNCDRTSRLYEISKANRDDWGWLTVAMIDESWTVEQCKAAVDAVQQVSAIPEWLQPAFPPDIYKLKAIGDERLIADLNTWVETATKHYESLPEHREVKRVQDNDEYSVEYWNLRELFVDSLQSIKSPSVKRINQAAQTVLLSVSALDDQFTAWQNARESQEAQQAAKEEAARQELERIEKYSPVGIFGNVREVLQVLEAQSLDLVLTRHPEQNITPDEWIKPIAPLLKDGGMMVVVCSHGADWEIRRIADLCGLEPLEYLVWEKVESKFMADAHSISHELILVFRNPGKEYESKVNGAGSVLHHETGNALIEYLMSIYSDEDGAVLDPFGGDGTTAIAAKSMGRCCTWIEGDEAVFERASSRIEQIKFRWELEKS